MVQWGTVTVKNVNMNDEYWTSLRRGSPLFSITYPIAFENAPILSYTSRHDALFVVSGTGTPSGTSSENLTLVSGSGNHNTYSTVLVDWIAIGKKAS